MNIIRILSLSLAVGFLAIGWLIGVRTEQTFGNALVLAGAIIIGSLLISMAITEHGRNGTFRQ
jgi:hypothetical protein